jgi:hypothetical protein
VGGEALAHGEVGSHGGFREGRDGGGRGGGRGAEDVFEHEDAAEDGGSAGGVGGDREDAAVAEETAAVAAGREGDAAEAAAVDAGDVVVAGEAFVEEGVIGFEEGAGWCDLRGGCSSKKQFGFLAEGLAEVVVEVAEEVAAGDDGVDVTEAEPLSGEVSGEVFRAGVGEEAASLAFEFGGLAELARRRGGGVRRRGCCSRGRTRGGRRVRGRRCGRRRLGGIGFDAEEEFGVSEDGGDGGGDAVVEACLGAALAVEGE